MPLFVVARHLSLIPWSHLPLSCSLAYIAELCSPLPLQLIFFFYSISRSYWSGWCWYRPSPARWPIPASCPSGTTTAPAPARPPARTVRSSCSKCHGMPSLEAFFCLFVLLANMERSLSLGHVPPCSPQAIFKDPFRRGNNILVSFHFYHPQVTWTTRFCVYSSLVQLRSVHLCGKKTVLFHQVN